MMDLSIISLKEKLNCKNVLMEKYLILLNYKSKRFLELYKYYKKWIDNLLTNANHLRLKYLK